MAPDPSWAVEAERMRLHTRWFTLVAEQLLTSQGQHLDYWRIERADSAIVIPRNHHHLVLPPPIYRPGVGTATLDFPGGRIGDHQTPAAAARHILQRELALPESAIGSITALNSQGWAINSSFSNQRLYGFIAQIDLADAASVAGEPLRYYAATPAGFQALAADLSCLQCRAVLLEARVGGHLD